MPLEVHSQGFDARLAVSSFTLWVYAFGMFLVAVELTNGAFLASMFFGPIVTYFLVKMYSIPQPPPAVVAELFGKKLIPAGQKEDENTEDEGGGGLVMKVIAHRFAGRDAPENTLEALEICYKNGAMAAEFDLVLTKDLVPILFHDIELDRVTVEKGLVQDKTWAELKDLDCTMDHPLHERFKGTKISLFEDIIKRVVEYDMRVFIDIKDDRPEIVRVICETFDKYPKLYKRAVVSSFNFWVVYNIRRKNHAIACSMAWRPHYMTYCKFSVVEDECIPYSKSPLAYFWARMLDHLTTWFFNHLACPLTGFSAVLLCKDIITPEIVRYWDQQNVRVFSWTVNSPLEKTYHIKHLGVTYMTDTLLES